MKQGMSKLAKLNIFLIVLIVGAGVALNAQVSSISFSVEKIKTQIKKQENRNQSLTMKINELASPENVQLVAQNLGLEYNNNNIITISE